MKRREFVGLAASSIASAAFGVTGAKTQAEDAGIPASIAELEGHESVQVLAGQKGQTAIGADRILMNWGGGTSYSTPEQLRQGGYNATVAGNVGELQLFDAVVPGILPVGSPERIWAEQKIPAQREDIRKTHAAGLTTYASLDLIVFPKRLIERFADQICDDKGNIDILRSKTQELLAAQMHEMFSQFPELDGVIIRTGEVYLHGLPYHGTSTAAHEKLINGGTAILHGERSHLAILSVLREEVCRKLGKKLIYRTWDFGENFHENRVYYCSVTDRIEPHPNLIFSVKHQKGDFLRLTVFNPTLMIGRHRQIIEVQSQREVYGKGAYPFYIGKGVIDGWEEYEWLMYPTAPHGLRDVVNHPLYAGMWTWSLGGGWDGPTIKNQFWPEMNTYVMRECARNTARTEPEIFAAYARSLGLNEADAARLRQICLLSAQAVLRGQCTTLGAHIDLWWNRDDKMGHLDLTDFANKGLEEASIAEKRNSVALWTSMEELARLIHFRDKATSDFVVTSCIYGRFKHAIVAEAWTALMLGMVGERSGHYDKVRIRTALKAYDQLWVDWRQLEASNPMCSTLYHDYGFAKGPGIGVQIDQLRAIVA